MESPFSRLPVFLFSRFLILAVVAALLNPQASAQMVEIPDPNLRQAVRQVLNLSDNIPITEQDMLRLAGFAAEDAGIENITGLEYAHNLRSLFLRNNPIEDLTPQRTGDSNRTPG